MQVKLTHFDIRELPLQQTLEGMYCTSTLLYNIRRSTLGNDDQHCAFYSSFANRREVKHVDRKKCDGITPFCW